MTRIMLRFSTIALLLLFVVGCATLGIETKEKQFLVAQKEVNSALKDYKVFLLAQTPEDQALLHGTYDKPIRAMSAALDAWQQVVMGITLDTGQLAEFMRIKNQLITLGWSYFSEGGDK